MPSTKWLAAPLRRTYSRLIISQSAGSASAWGAGCPDRPMTTRGRCTVFMRPTVTATATLQLTRALRIRGPCLSGELRASVGLNAATYARTIATMRQGLLSVGAIRSLTFALRRTIPGAWRQAWAAAELFWAAVAGDEAIQVELRQVAVENGARLAESRQTPRTNLPLPEPSPINAQPPHPGAQRVGVHAQHLGSAKGPFDPSERLS